MTELNKKLSFALIFFVVFASFLMLISSWIGSIGLFPIPVLVISLILSYFVSKKYFFEFSLNFEILALAILMFILCAYPLLFIHPFFPASSDVVHVTNLRILGDVVPVTYEPYSALQFTYQFGFALFVNAFAEIIPAPDYLLNWFFAIIFCSLAVIFIYELVFTLTKNRANALLAAVLIFGSKFLFQNFYYGVYPFIASFAFLALALLMLEKRNYSALLFIPVVVTLHPFTGTMLLGFVLLKTCFEKFKDKFSFFAILSFAIAIPSLIRTYATVFSNAAKSTSQAGLIIPELSFFTTVVLWLGVVPSVFYVFVLFFNRKFSNYRIYSLFLFLGYILTYVIGLEHNDKFFLVFSFFAIITIGLEFEWKIIENALSFIKNHKHILILALLILCLFSFYFSGDLSRGRSGTKATTADYDFALKFKEFDPALQKTIFLSGGYGWISMISNKIPLNVRHSHLIPDSGIQVVNDSGWVSVLENEKTQKAIEAGCIECIKNSGFYYLVVDARRYTSSFPFKKAFSYKTFDVYYLN